MPFLEDQLKEHPFGEDGRVDPASIAPEDEEEAASPAGPSRGVAVRAVSVVPFLLLAALGLIAIIGWLLVVVFGAGSAEPIWRSLRGLTLAQVAGQLAFAALVLAVPVLVTVAASWAAVRGFGEDAGRVFWTTAQAFWGLVAVALVLVDRLRPQWLAAVGLSSFDWWFLFAVVAFAMVIAGVRVRQARRTT